MRIWAQLKDDWREEAKKIGLTVEKIRDGSFKLGYIRVSEHERPHISIDDLYYRIPKKLSFLIDSFTLRYNHPLVKMGERKLGIYLHREAAITVSTRYNAPKENSGIWQYLIEGRSSNLEDLRNIVNIFMAGKILPVMDWGANQIKEESKPKNRPEELRAKIRRLQAELWVSQGHL